MDVNLIRIDIEEVIEDWQKYYLAKSPDERGFLAQTDTLEEMYTTAPEVMSLLLKAKKNRLEAEYQEQKFHNLQLLLNYSRITPLQFA